jgi:hypothetical protein
LNPPGDIRVERFGWTFCPGDKVMQIENDYDKEVYNGDLGVVSRIDTEESELAIDFDGREVIYGFGELDELVLAYATTIHKSQGSEYPAVVFPLTTQHYVMLQRDLVYTGVTRGKRLVVLVGQRKALAIAVNGAQTRRRWSKLRERLAERRTGSVTASHRWAFKSSFRPRAFGWRSSALAGRRLKEAVSEIKAVAKFDRVLAADGVVALMERLWPALEHIDTSSGALGNAVNRALDELIPLLIAAPADVARRAAWLERLFQAVMDDGVQYLVPVEDRWGEIAVYPELMNGYAERLRGMIRRVWAEEPPGGYVVGTTICLSCLLETGRYEDLIELLTCARTRWWHWYRFGAEALARQGMWDAAIAYAESCRQPHQYDHKAIDRFCESASIKNGKADEAYRSYGLRSATGPTNLSIYRNTIDRYPDRDRRQVLLDLIEARGERGKWFAAAKEAGFLDIALGCARDSAVEPATLVRAARDLAVREPKFATEIALIALQCLLAGSGYDPEPRLVRDALDHRPSARCCRADRRPGLGDAAGATGRRRPLFRWSRTHAARPRRVSRAQLGARPLRDQTNLKRSAAAFGLAGSECRKRCRGGGRCGRSARDRLP